MNACDRPLIKKRRVCFSTALRQRAKSFEIIQTERFSSTFTLYVIFFCTTKSCFSLLLISGSLRMGREGGSLVHLFCQSEKLRGNIFFFFFFFFKLSPCKSDFTVGLRNHTDIIDILKLRIYEISVSPHRLLSDYRTEAFSTNKF